MVGIETNLIMVLMMFDHEVESLFDGLRWFASGSPIWFCSNVLYEIPHS